MMNRWIWISIIIACVCRLPAHAQSSVDVVTGMHYHANASQTRDDNFPEKYWNPSANGGIRLHVPMAASVNLVASFVVNHYFYRNASERRTPSDSGRIFIAMSGDDTNVLRAMLAVELIDRSDARVRPYGEIGAGYIGEMMGTVHGRVEYLKYIMYAKDVVPKDRWYAAYTIGGGGIFSLCSHVVLDASIHFYSNTADRAYYLFGIGVGYEL